MSAAALTTPGEPRGRARLGWTILAAVVLARAALPFVPTMWTWGLNLQRFLAPLWAWLPWAAMSLPRRTRGVAPMVSRMLP